MRIRAVTFILAVILCGFVAPIDAAVTWTRLRSANFTLEGDVPVGDLRAVARRLEQFREVLGRQLPKARLATPTPLTVMVFAHDRDFKPVKPLFEGKPIEASGYFGVTPIGTSIAICLEAGERAYPTIYHEYGHLLISNALPRLPLWLEEGLAEYYSTFRLSTDLRRATVGRPIPQVELDLLRGRRLLPVAEVLAAGHNSRLYNVGADRSRFYAQSWALVHYLVLGNPARSRQFVDFVNRIAAGVAPDEAFAAAFPEGTKALEAELTDYVNSLTFSAMETRFTEQVAAGQTMAVSRMSGAEVEASYGHLLLRQRRFDEADARFAEALRQDSAVASAHTGVGLVHLERGDPVAALAPLRRGAELDPGNAMAHFALGYGALNCRVAGCELAQGGSAAAREEFQRAVEILPEFPDALSFLGFAEMDSGADLANAERHLVTAITLLPGRQDYRLHLAQIYLRQENYAKAQGLLGPISASAVNEEHKAAARRLLGTIAELVNAKTARAASTAASGSAAAASAGSSSVSTPGPAGGRSMPAYRRLGADEHRIEGTLESIECPKAGIVVAVRDDSGVHRFSAPRFEAIDFITYRDDLKGTVTCGPQSTMRVYLTWRASDRAGVKVAAGPQVQGVVVAIEYLPKEK